MEEEGGGGDEQERTEGFDDLFEDLDRFFAPDPAEARRRRLSGSDQGDAGSPEGGAGQPVTGADEAVDAPGDELLPADWRPDIESLGGDEGPAGEPDGHELPEVSTEASSDEAQEGTSSEPPGQEPAEPPATRGWAAEPTAEMTGQDWTRLRDVLGEEQDESEAYAYESETPEVASDESLFGYEEESRPDWLGPAGGGHELTLDDLKKAPAEYSELPGPRDEQGSTDVSVTASGGWDPGGGEVEDVPGTPEDAAASADREGEASSEVAAEEPEWPEPTIAEVEAAADQLAEEFRDAEAPSEVEAELLSDLEEPSGPRTVRVGATESLTGPTWEEPTSQPIMGETPGPVPGPGTGPSRNMAAAVGTAAALALGAVVTLVIAKWLFVIMAGAVVLLGQFELYATMQRRGHRPATALGLAVGGFMMAGAYRKGEPAVSFFLALGLFLSFLWYMAAPLKARENLIRNIGSTLLGIVYVPMLAGYVFMLLAQPHSGRALMLTVIGLAFVYDIAAYGFGSFWGSRPLAPTISPRKSWEGLFGATVITFALAIVLVPAAVDYLTPTRALGLAIVIIVFAPLGDLVESLIKRDLGVKDMGSVLPGHGGVLDRIDSVLLVAPAAFYYIRLIF